jgi:chloramphenicol-sensitive protein RarD
VEAALITSASPRDAAHDRRTGTIAGLTAYLIWGALTAYWKLLHHFNAFELVGWRIISAAVVMTAVLTVTKRWQHLRPVLRDRDLLARVALAALLLTANWTTYVWAVVHGRVLETALGYFMAPLATIAIGVVVFHERLRRAQMIAIGLAVAAVVVLTVSYGTVPWVALVLAASWSIYGWLKKQVPLTPLESMSAESFVVLIPAIVVVTAFAGSSTSIPSTASAGEWALVAFTGVATVVPLMLFAWAAQRVPLTILGPMNYLVPSINFVLGWAVYGEAMPPERIAGFALVWVGLAITTVDSVRWHRRTAQSRLEPSTA